MPENDGWRCLIVKLHTYLPNTFITLNGCSKADSLALVISAGKTGAVIDADIAVYTRTSRDVLLRTNARPSHYGCPTRLLIPNRNRRQKAVSFCKARTVSVQCSGIRLTTCPFLIIFSPSCSLVVEGEAPLGREGGM